MAVDEVEQLLAALLRAGWTVDRQEGSHKVLVKAGWQPYTFAFHDGREIQPFLVAKVAKACGLKPGDL